MKTKILIAVGMTALNLFTDSNCTGDQHTHAKVCVHEPGTTENEYHSTRLADADCDSKVKGSRWRFFDEDFQVPAVGAKIELDSGSWSIGPRVKSVTIPADGGTAHDQIKKG